MRRTGPGILLTIAAVAALGGFLVDQILTATGRATYTPLITLPVLLVALGAIVVALAVPVWRASRGHTRASINPFRALRIAMLAKASSLLGAGAVGFAAGLLVFLLTRPVVPPLGSMTTQLLTLGAGILLVVAGLVAEHLCTIRKDDDDEQPGGVDPGFGTHGH